MDYSRLLGALISQPQPTAQEQTSAHDSLVKALVGAADRVVGFPQRYMGTYRPGQSVLDNPGAVDWSADMALNMVGMPGGRGGLGSGARMREPALQHNEPPIGAQPITANPPVQMKLGTLDAALQELGVPFRKDNSQSLGSLSTYYYVETPAGTKKIRISDHAGGVGEDIDFKYGDDAAKSLERLAGFLGRKPEGGFSDQFSRQVEAARIRANMERWPDSPALLKWKAELGALLGK